MANEGGPMVCLARIYLQCPRGAWRKSRTLLAGLAALYGLAPAAGAQTAPPLQAGTRIRLIAPANGVKSPCYEGSLVSLQGDTVAIHTLDLSCPHRLTVALGTDWRVEERASHHDHAILGAVLGAGLVLGVGALIDASSDPGFTPGVRPMVGAVLVAPVFALGGAFIGAQLGRDTWVPVRTDGVRVEDAGGEVEIRLPL